MRMAFVSQTYNLRILEQVTNRRNPFRIMKSDGSDNEEQQDTKENVGVPIELESLQTPTLFGLEKQQDVDALNTGVPTFTGVIILAYSVYFTFSLLYGSLEGSSPPLLDDMGSSLPLDGTSLSLPVL